MWPAVVVGAGAAGFLAAIFAGRAGVPVLLLETRPQPGAKIRVSGGGRCNVLPSEVTLEDFHTQGSMHALRNVLFSWPLPDVRDFFERDLGLPLLREPTGKLFPQSNRARDVVAALLHAGAAAGVRLRGGFRVTEVRYSRSGAGRFAITSEGGETVHAEHLVLTTGGKSLPKTGSDGGGYALALSLGIPVLPTYPALVPLCTPESRFRALAGISLPVRLRAVRASKVVETRCGDFLFTHRGFSGPVVLDMSRHLTSPDSAGTELCVEWGGDVGWEALLRAGGKRRVASVVREHLPERLSETLLDMAGVPRDRRLADLGRDERFFLQGHLDAFPLPVQGDEGYATAEVTCGGVPLSELHLRTLESRRVPGLYFAGEILDATGRIGGYNFLWAWVTGRKVGMALAAATSPNL